MDEPCIPPSRAQESLLATGRRQNCKRSAVQLIGEVDTGCSATFVRTRAQQPVKELTHKRHWRCWAECKTGWARPVNGPVNPRCRQAMRPGKWWPGPELHAGPQGGLRRQRAAAWRRTSRSIQALCQHEGDSKPTLFLVWKPPAAHALRPTPAAAHTPRGSGPGGFAAPAHWPAPE